MTDFICAKCKETCATFGHNSEVSEFCSGCAHDEIERLRKAMRNALGHVDHLSIHYILKVALGDEVTRW